MMGNRRSTDVSDEEVIDVYLAGNSAGATAKLTGIGETTVYRILATHNVPRRTVIEAHEHRARFHAEKAREIRQQYEAGATFADLVREHGGTEYSVKRAIRVAGGRLKPVTPPLSAADGAAILKRAKAGMSQLKISLELGRSQSTVTRFLRSQGFEYPRVCGEAHGHWKGGRTKSGGYWKVLIAFDDPMASMADGKGYVPEHRLNLARHLGRALLPTETVHHINGDKLDNRLENLQLRQGLHGKGARFVCLDCGSHNVEAAPLH